MATTVFLNKQTNICWFIYELRGFYNFALRNIAFGQYHICGTMLGICCVGVGECQPHKRLACKISYKTRRQVSDSQEKATVSERQLLTQRLDRPTGEDESAFLVTVWEFCSSTH